MTTKTQDRNAYYREYRRKNPRKTIEAQLKYWNKKLKELEEMERQEANENNDK